MIRRQIFRAGWTAVALLVLTSCRMRDTKQAYPGDEGVTQQQDQAAGRSEKYGDPGETPGLPGEPAAGNDGEAGRAGAAGNAGAAGGDGAPGMMGQWDMPGPPDWKRREPLSGQYKTWEPPTSLSQAGSLRRGTYGAACPLSSQGRTGSQNS
ncbi:MAG: hypothetical protein LUK37_07055 [Clostridia bacterium]|nr:hypothetical protein [Clostridia bacterium]